MVNKIVLICVLLVLEPTKPAPIVLKELSSPDLWVCAEYTSTSAPRKPNRSCQPATVVREWLLQEGRNEGCDGQ